MAAIDLLWSAGGCKHCVFQREAQLDMNSLQRQLHTKHGRLLIESAETTAVRERQRCERVRQIKKHNKYIFLNVRSWWLQKLTIFVFS